MSAVWVEITENVLNTDIFIIFERSPTVLPVSDDRLQGDGVGVGRKNAQIRHQAEELLVEHVRRHGGVLLLGQATDQLIELLLEQRLSFLG